MQKHCSITVDVDTAGSLFPGVESHDESYINCMQRFLDIFDEYGVKATFFIVGKDLSEEKNIPVTRILPEKGHEIANHSMNHIQGLFTLSKEQKVKEISDSEQLILEKTGVRVKGFRAPGWNVDNDILDILQERNYRYDSSFFPTLLTPLIKLRYFFNGRDVPVKRRKTLGRFRNMFSSGRIYKIRDSLYEYPLSLTPVLRLPFYGTMIFECGTSYFDFFYKYIKSGNMVNFSLHLAELADMNNDFSSSVVDSSVNKAYIPACITLPLEKKLEILSHILKSFRNDFDFTTMNEAINQHTRNA